MNLAADEQKKEEKHPVLSEMTGVNPVKEEAKQNRNNLTTMELNQKDIQTLSFQIARIIRPYIEKNDSRWIKLSKAANYSGICKDRLIALAENGTIIGFSDPDNKRGDWVFDRESIDQYRLNQGYKLKKRVLDIVNGL